MNIDPSYLQPTSIIGYFLVFLGGIITSIGPCNVAMIPLIMAMWVDRMTCQEKRPL